MSDQNNYGGFHKVRLEYNGFSCSCGHAELSEKEVSPVYIEARAAMHLAESRQAKIPGAPKYSRK